MTNTSRTVIRIRSDMSRTMKSLERHIGEMHHNRNKLIGLYKRLDTLKRPADIDRCVENIKHVRAILDGIADTMHTEIAALDEYNDTYVSTHRQDISSVKREIDAAESDIYRAYVSKFTGALFDTFAGR